MGTIYEVTSDYDACLQTTKEWRRYEKQHYLCLYNNCYKLNRSKYPQPIDVTVTKLSKEKYLRQGISLSVTGLYHIDFIEQIKQYMEGFVFGRCFLPDGTLVKDYVTCYSKDFIVIRGALGSKYIECAECGSVVGYPAKNPKYVLRRYLKENKVYQDATLSLYIDEDLAMNLDFSRWPKTELEQIPIRDKPVDKCRLLCDPEDLRWQEDKKENLLYKVVFSIFPEFSEPEPVFAESHWLKEQAGKLLCPKCNYVRRMEFPRPLNIVLERPPEEGLPCALVETTGVTIWHVAFLETIKEFLGGFAIGDCYLADGTPVNEYKTCYSHEFILERGNQKSRYQTCPECNSMISCVRPGPVYVLGKTLGQNHVFQDAKCGFYLTEEVASLFSFKNWEVKEDYYGYYIYLDPIAIKETACDGQLLPMDK